MSNSYLKVLHFDLESSSTAKNIEKNPNCHMNIPNLTGVTPTKDGVTISFADGSQSNNAGGRLAPALSCAFIRATQ